MRTVIMGVSGSGKSSLGQRLANHCAMPFVEGDLLHSPSSIAKMAAGTPLEDIDRWPWLDAISAAMARPKKGAIASCSCLRKAYRDRLRASLGSDLRFVFVDVPPQILFERLMGRAGHFMPASLLTSQLATLERPVNEGDVLMVDGERTIDALVSDALAWTCPAV